IAANQLGDGARAIDLYRGILAEAPSDSGAIRQLALLYETHERLADLLALRRHELSLAPPVSRRLELRLDIARVLGVLGDRDARLAALRDNLSEEPGHETSIDEVSLLLEGESNHRVLADLLAEQAAALETRGDTSHGSRLWARVAVLAETRLDDVPRAIGALRRVVALGATTEALDSLARLHSTRGEHADAVSWLEQRLALTTGEDRSAVVVKLARAHLGAGRTDRALTTLETALAETPAALDVRTLLAELYRTSGAWEPLAKLLHDGADQTEDSAARFTYLRESADIYQRRLMLADVAIPILERAVSLAPQDRSVRTALADAFRAATRLEEARVILEGLIAEFGRRRPPERAAVHFSLAQIARARGDMTEALAQLDVASSMDMQHPGIARMLGDLARNQGQLDRAEKAYRALLLSVRRQKPEALDAPDGIGASEVLFELYRLAQLQGETDRAREVLESAFEAAAQSDAEGRRFEAALRGLNDPELLLRSLQNRLARTTNPDAAAAILRDLASVLTGLGRVSEALDASLKALEGTPGSTALLDASRQLATEAGALPRYAETLATAAERARDQGELGLACDLFLRLGALYEADLGDLTRAAAMYAAAEATGDRLVEAWRALDRVCAASGDKAGQVRALRQWVDAGVDGEAAVEQLDALYRLAAIELADESRRDEGCEALTWALDREPQYARAAEMLRMAAQEAPTHVGVLQLFERVARASGDAALLLEALERLAALPDAPTELFREAVEIAGKLEEHARAEALLRRAIDIARDRDGGLSDAVWALVALAQKRKAASDLHDAIRWLREASEAAEPGEAFELALEVGALAAGAVNDLGLAAATYEKLRAKEPGDRNVWEPLLDVYRRLGDKERLAGLIAITLENVYDSSERNRLRMERARLLLEEGGHDDDAIQVLRDILEEDPAATDAAQMLMDKFERAGRTEDLADLVRRQLESARDRADNAQVAALSVRLGGLLEPTSRTDAMDTYRAALDWMPEHRGVLEALVRLYSPEDDQNDRADAMERLLGLEKGEAASTLALALIVLREAQSDEAGIQRALDRGFRGAPAHAEIRERLLHWYNDRQDWLHLAEVIAFDASSRAEVADAVALYREAAGLYRDQIGDAIGAAAALRSARALVPGDLELLKEAALALSLAGEHEAAAAEIADAITHYDSEA
ncbi:MAG: tetratricopeptide repeat protein, partial [Deltaproteobacteria bacterium]